MGIERTNYLRVGVVYGNGLRVMLSEILTWRAKISTIVGIPLK